MGLPVEAPKAAPAGRPASGALPASATAAAAHPLDPLTRDEIDRAVAILRRAGKADAASRFPEVALREPPKEEVLRWKRGDPIARAARLVVMDRPANASHEAVVDLEGGRVVSWEAVSGGQPPMLFEEYETAGEAVRADPRWRAAMERRGVRDLDGVYLDVWAPGEMEAPGAGDARIARVLSNRQGEQKNPYGPPIEGVVAVVNLNTMAVIDVVDTGPVPVARVSTDVYAKEVTGEDRSRPGALRRGVEPPAYAVAGHEVRWDRWRFRFSCHPREGLVLHQVGLEDHGRVRPVIYRASVSEMLVPYGDPAETWSWRSAFDEGEYGLGRLANPLERGRSAPDGAALFDAAFCDDAGASYVLPGAVMLYERDGGLLWSHYDMDAGTAARRGRELVIASIATIGNYDYVCSWIFRQDATIEFEASLTGCLLTKGVPSRACEVCPSGAAARGTVEPTREQRHGTLVAENVLAPNHQHFVSVRLDLDVDGTSNRVKEVNVRADVAGPDDARGNAFVAVPTYLATEGEASRAASPLEHRTWEVLNDAHRNALGHPSGYMLVPGETAVPFLRPGTALRALGAFAERPFWATRYHEGEMHAAGPFPSQAKRPGGLAVWTKDDESLEDQDLVVWYTVGVTHVPRAEEFPVMPTHRAGFRLVPAGFFERNPALDVPDAPAR